MIVDRGSLPSTIHDPRFAVGPTSPTVTLTIDIEFKKLMSRHPVVIEAAADEFGKVQAFAFAGTLEVRGGGVT